MITSLYDVADLQHEREKRGVLKFYRDTISEILIAATNSAAVCLDGSTVSTLDHRLFSDENFLVYGMRLTCLIDDNNVLHMFDGIGSTKRYNLDDPGVIRQLRIDILARTKQRGISKDVLSLIYSEDSNAVSMHD